jgi:hypothetical protein
MRCTLEINNHRNVFLGDFERSRDIILEVRLREFGAPSHRQAPDLSGDDCVLAFFDRDRSAAKSG